MRRRTLLAAPALAVHAACPRGQDDGRVRFALDWFPEVEHGGFFAADVGGEFAAAGLAVDILSGGPDVPVIPQVAAGRVDFGLADAATVLAARAQQAPVVAVFAAMRHSPRCILVHDPGPRSLAELRDLTLAMSVREPFSQFLAREVGLAGVTVVPYGGSVAPFLADPKLAQQAYVFSEPIVVARQGAAARCLMVAELGFDPYAGLVIASERTIAGRPDLVRRFVGACARGWSAYLRDPSAAHARIHERNPEMDLDTLARGAAALAPLVAPDAPGGMDPQRWQTLHAQLAGLAVYPADATDPTTAFRTDFLP
jgi:NitT/TauT family transport system substrate-binding protein